jgi:hypothetical protein
MSSKAFGAQVTGVCSTKSVDMVRSIGADHVIDYTQEDFTRSGQRYDLILEMDSPDGPVHGGAGPKKRRHDHRNVLPNRKIATAATVLNRAIPLPSSIDHADRVQPRTPPQTGRGGKVSAPTGRWAAGVAAARPRPLRARPAGSA